MSLGSALRTAVSGLRTTQAGINLVSQNVANAGSVGYTRRTMSTVEALAGDRSSGVRSGEVQRVLDLVAQRQLRLESSAAGYTGVRADFASALERLFGQPGATGSLDGAVNAFTQSLQALAGNPGDSATRAQAVDRAGALAGLIGTTAEAIQGLRTDAEARIGSIVGRADTLLQAVQAVNAKIVSPQGATPDAALLDERDRLVGELSTLMDLQVTVDANQSMRLSTSAGQTLFDGHVAVRLGFDARSSLGPGSVYSASGPSGVGTVTATTGAGGRIDLIARGAFRSGEIAAAIEMRDDVLVRAQRQLDELAAGLATAMSETRRAGAAIANGFSVDAAGAQAGDTLTVSYVDAGGTRRDATVLFQTGGAPSLAPSPADPARPVFTYDLGDRAASAAALGPLLGAGFTVTDVAGTVSVTHGSGRALDLSYARPATMSGAPSGRVPLLVDGFTADTQYGGVHPAGLQLTGLAQRLQVNPAVLANSKLVNGAPLPPPAPPLASGDATRANQLVDNLTRAARAFSPAAGIGGSAATFSGSVTDFARRVVETQGADAQAAISLDEGQRIALASIESRFAETSGVNIDQEMAQLVQLQTAYGANARVMSAVRDMLDMLMRI